MSGVLLLALVTLCFLLGGAAAARAVLAGDDDGDAGTQALARAVATTLLALAAALGTSWLLAMAGLLRAPWLVAASLPFGAAGVPNLLRALRDARSGANRTVPNTWLAPVLGVLVLASWGGFAMWRASLVPPYNHDALAYHMPRAALFVQNGSLAVPSITEGRIASWPCNYELLLADTMLLVGSDALTGWIGVASWCALLLVGAAITARAWGFGAHVVFSALLVAASPIAILHTGLHKNDLMECALILGTAFWLEAWFRRGSTRALALGLLAFCLALGTKLQGFFLGAVTVPVVLWGAVRHRRYPRGRREWAIATAFPLTCFLFLGGLVYVLNVARHHVVAIPPEQRGGGYGAFLHLLIYPYLVLAAPFSSIRGAVWVPWRAQYWWWPDNDVWISHFGALFTALVLSAPILGFLRRKDGNLHARAFVTVFVLAVAALILPVRVAPLGYVNGASRYLFFLVPVIVSWVASPIYLRAERAWRGVPVALIAVAIVHFGHAAWRYGVNDAYCPWEWVSYRSEHPEDRRPAVRRNRAGSALDAMADPRDAVAVDVAFDTWIYPIYGAGLTRSVRFLPRTKDKTPIPDDVQWVVVDRTWNVFWGHPELVDMSRPGLIGRGMPTEDDTKVARELAADPAWALVYSDVKQNQWLFRRREVAASPP